MKYANSNHKIQPGRERHIHYFPPAEIGRMQSSNSATSTVAIPDIKSDMAYGRINHARMNEGSVVNGIAGDY